MRVAVVALALAACAADPEILSVTALGSTHDTSGPYLVDAVVTNAGADEVELMVGIDTADPARFQARSMTESIDELYTGAIAGQPAGTDVFYVVRVVRDGEELARAPDDGLAAAFSFQVLAPGE